MTSHESSSFYDLQVDDILNTAELCNYTPTGAYFQLNSYENRVFDLFLEEDGQGKKHVIVKIYRPGRWSREAILEEHEFISELKAAGSPAVAPVILPNGSTVYENNGLFYSFFPKAYGRMPQELSLDDLRNIGLQLAKLHNVGSQKIAHHRPLFDIETYGWKPLDILEDWIAPEVSDRYFRAAEQILNAMEDRIDTSTFLRIHGDCHRGNILQTDPAQGAKQNFFVDFDDFVNGPAVQDFWMLLSGSASENSDELEALIEGYDQLRAFPRHTLDWIPGLRGLRIIHYAGWIARRWEDPSFAKIFPDFKKYIYWAEEVEALEKIAWSMDA